MVLALSAVSLKQRRARVSARVRKIKDRLAHLSGAERLRLGRTRYWKALYLRRLKQLGAGDPKTIYAHHQYHTSQALGRTIDHNQAVLHRRASRKIKWLLDHPESIDPDHDCIVVVDGKPVSAEVAQEFLRVRNDPRSQAEPVIVSGYRTPQHSQDLCFGICGHPSCPGLCAGLSSNHTKKSCLGSGQRLGAVDITDYIRFAQDCRRCGSWLENHLPRDLVHFSDSGQ